MNILEAFELYRFYHTENEETRALRGISLCVGAGEIVAVTGPSGSGKSTLLACLSGIDEPDGGYVMLNGKRMTRKSEAERAAIRASEIGIVMQSKNLLANLTIKDNIRMKMWLSHKVDNKRTDELLEFVGLTQRRDAYPSQVSGGEAARAAIAVALSAKPKLLLADEPTGEVDAQTELKIVELFEHFRKSGGAAVIATHSQSLARYADRTIALLDGRVRENV